MSIIIGVIIVGIIIGCLNIISYKHKEKLTWISRLALFVMIFCLAAKVGCDKELLQNLDTLGKRSMLMVVGIIGGAFLSVTIVRHLFARTIDELLEEGKKQ